MFAEQFDLALPASANFIGGGGKTSLILRLLEEYSWTTPVIYTTTTRIHPPHPTAGLTLLSGNDLALLKHLLDRAGRNCRNGVCKFVITRSEFRPGLLMGVPPDFARSIDQQVFPVILNEADGARSMSLKMPREGEPVLMQGAKYVIPVIGLDCLNRPLGPTTLFRWEMASQRCSLTLGRILTPTLAASLLLHPEGVCKDCRPGTNIIPYINKVDTEHDDILAVELARALLDNPYFPVQKVVWGSLLAGRSYSLSTNGE